MVKDSFVNTADSRLFLYTDDSVYIYIYICKFGNFLATSNLEQNVNALYTRSIIRT